MAHHKSALKRIKTSEIAKEYNRGFKKRLRLTIKSLREAKDQQSAQEPLKSAISLLDKMSSKNIIHKNKAANQKSTLTRFFNKLA